MKERVAAARISSRPGIRYRRSSQAPGSAASTETDRNCHFRFFAVSRQNSAFAPNYDYFPNPNNYSSQNFSATPRR